MQGKYPNKKFTIALPRRKSLGELSDIRISSSAYAVLQGLDGRKEVIMCNSCSAFLGDDLSGFLRLAGSGRVIEVVCEACEKMTRGALIVTETTVTDTLEMERRNACKQSKP